MAQHYQRNYDEYGRRPRRDWSDRAGDEVRSWFGDDEAQARRERDEYHERRLDARPYGDWSGRADEAAYRGDGWGTTGRGYERDYRSSPEHLWRHRESRLDLADDDRWRFQSDRDRWGRSDSSDWHRASSPRRQWPGYSAEASENWRQQGDGGTWYGPPPGDRWDYRRSESPQVASFGASYGYGGSTRGYGGADADRYESYAGRGPKDYQRSDERIREEVSDRMTDDYHLDASNISVQVQKCEVTLTGTVGSREQKRRAEDLAERTSGVKDVANNLRVARDNGDDPGKVLGSSPLGLTESARGGKTVS